MKIKFWGIDIDFISAWTATPTLSFAGTSPCARTEEASQRRGSCQVQFTKICAFT